MLISGTSRFRELCMYSGQRFMAGICEVTKQEGWRTWSDCDNVKKCVKGMEGSCSA